MSNDEIGKETSSPAETPTKKSVRKHHLIRPWWIRVPLKILLWLLLIIVLIPILIYFPPVQSLLKDVACDMASKSTGMKIEAGYFRLRFPLDVELDDVLIIEAQGDTMVRARELLADVKLRPLFDKEIKLKGLRLREGYYRMVSADSSMIMRLQAGLLDVDGRSSFSLGDMNLNLHRARLRDADVQMYMDVWKKEQTPTDTTSTPFKINATRLDLENVSFAMSMLPSIDTLRLQTNSLRLEEASIDLGTNEIKAKYLGADGGDFTYLTPTAAYIKSHPAPIDSVSTPGPPMTISADSIALNDFNVLYGIAGAHPQPGFDANYVSLSDVNISLKDFYNQSSTLRVPITRLMAKERCGLQILSGSGIFRIDSIGLNLQDIALRTANSQLTATASIPFALMELKPTAAMSADANGNVGLADLGLFMPSLKEYTNMVLPSRNLLLRLDAAGTLASLDIKQLQAELPQILELRAKGHVDNVLKPDKLKGALDFRGSLTAPQIAQRMIGMKDVTIPRFSIAGNAEIGGGNYAADFTLESSAGDLAAAGRVNMNAESYEANVNVMGLNVGHIMPSLGVGEVTAKLTAHGAGFNPTARGAATDIALDVAHADYGGHRYHGIRGTVGLHNGIFDVDLSSQDSDAELTVVGSGSISPGNYSADVTAHVHHLDLQALGLSETMNNGSGDIYIKGTASPDKWLYNVELDAQSLEWNLPDNYIHLPAGVYATLQATSDNVDCHIESDEIALDFSSPNNLHSIVDKFSAAATAVEKQIADKSIDIEALQKYLPQFTLDLNASGQGVLRQFLHPQGLAIDTIYANIQNIDSLLSGNIGLRELETASMTLDTITLGLNQRGSLLDYAVHLGNRATNQPEFMLVDMSGYIGGNRLSAYLQQRNDKLQEGYRLGFTAALQDSTVTLHFTPLKATIAYLPWTFNLDNHVDYNILTRQVDANLQAMSNNSSILLQTERDENNETSVHLNLTNIRVQDFLSLAMNAPPVKATVDADMRVKYVGRAFSGEGRLDVHELEYDRQKVGDLALGFNADVGLDGNTRAEASLLLEEKSVLTVSGIIRADENQVNPNDFTATLTEFPLSLANAFLGKDVAALQGTLNGEMHLAGQFTEPLLNGNLTFKDAGVYLPMMASTLKIDTSPIDVVDNVITFRSFKVFGQNENPLELTGNVDARKFSDIKMNLNLDGQNFQLLNNDKRSRADLYGKLFLNLGATVAGSMSRLDINGNLTVLNTTDVFYTLNTANNALTQQQTSDVVKFVNFADTTQVSHADSIAPQMAMRIRAGLSINPGTRVTVNLSTNGTDKVQLQPSGTLNYFQNYMGDMRLNGQLLLGEGFARYSMPIIGEKMFSFQDGSFVQWNGPLMNPILHINAYDDMKVNVSDNGNARLVNFLVTLAVSNTLESPKVTFDLEAEGDMTIQNELQSMTAEQRSNQAMNLLLYGQYSGPNTKTLGANNLAESAVYSFLTSKLNSWAANNIRGVDLSFGVDQYEQTIGGENSSTTSYSYQVSKSLFNNRFKIVVGGNYSTDASADENFAQNLLSNVSFEYLLKQTNSLTMLVKLFRHNDYESILEGEVSETGVGFVMRRRMDNLKRFFRVRWGKRKTPAIEAADSIPADTLTNEKPNN